MTRHNEIHDGVAYLVSKAFTPFSISDEPLIHPGWAVQEGKSQTFKSEISNNPSAQRNET